MLRLIGMLTLLYIAYWAGANDIGLTDVIKCLINLLAGVDSDSI